MSDDDDIPTIELGPDDHFENNKPYQWRYEDKFGETYLTLLFENYPEETIREALGKEYKQKRHSITDLVKRETIKI
ncbi:hypothetical protein [Halapricum desulfuricans]|uniref:hypothetical protein n=1 Tax=Halapricum desulfuricans TaxID=2841257 RepID=UPI001E3E4437|nr:hypothetical protein [Halapricum desulfuricans]